MTTVNECVLTKLSRKAGIKCDRCGRPARYVGSDGRVACGRCYGYFIRDCRSTRKGVPS